jgi:hypothetical protein
MGKRPKSSATAFELPENHHHHKTIAPIQDDLDIGSLGKVSK